MSEPKDYEPPYTVDLGPVENRLVGFADWLDNCLRSRKAWTETAPRFLEAMRDDLREAVTEIHDLRAKDNPNG